MWDKNIWQLLLKPKVGVRMQLGVMKKLITSFKKRKKAKQ